MDADRHIVDGDPIRAGQQSNHALSLEAACHETAERFFTKLKIVADAKSSADLLLSRKEGRIEDTAPNLVAASRVVIGKNIANHNLH